MILNNLRNLWIKFVCYLFVKEIICNLYFFYFFSDLSNKPKVRESLDNTTQLRGYIRVTILEQFTVYSKSRENKVKRSEKLSAFQEIMFSRFPDYLSFAQGHLFPSEKELFLGPQF